MFIPVYVACNFASKEIKMLRKFIAMVTAMAISGLLAFGCASRKPDSSQYSGYWHINNCCSYRNASQRSKTHVPLDKYKCANILLECCFYCIYGFGFANFI